MSRPKVHDGMTAKRRLTIELARIRRRKRLLPPIAPPPGTGGPGTGTVLGSGTAGHLAKWIAVDTLGDSLVRDDGNTVSIVRTTAAVDIFKILDADGSFMLDVDKDGLVGINCDPDALLTIQGGGLLPPVTSGLLAWYYAGSLSSTLSDGQNVTTWLDSWGNNHLTAAGGASAPGTSNATRPKYNVANAGSGKATTNLPTVSFEGTLAPDQYGYFTIDTGLLTLTKAAGWTIALIVRDYSNIANPSYHFGIDSQSPSDADNDFIEAIISGGNTRWDTASGSATIKSYCGLYTHTHGNDTEYVILRSTAGTGALDAYIDGGHLSAGDTRADVQHQIRYFGRHVVSALQALGIFGKAWAECLIWNRSLTDPEAATVNTYLANRLAGSAVGSTFDVMRWKNAGGTLKGRVDPEGNLVLARTTAPITGVIFKDLAAPYRWMPDYTDPSDDDFPNLFIGKNAGNFTINGDGTPSYEGTANIGIGERALQSLTKGYSNFAAGYHALGACTTGFFNFALGEESLGANLGGSNNVAVGETTLALNTSGGNNVAIGSAAGQTNETGSQNIYVGALADAAGAAFSNVIAIGYGTVVVAGNTIELGNPSHLATNIYGSTVVNIPSDGTFGTATALFDSSLIRFWQDPAVSGSYGAGVQFITGDGAPGFGGGDFSVVTGGGASGGAINLTATGATSIGGSINLYAGGGSSISNAGRYNFANPTAPTRIGNLNFSSLAASRTYTFPDATGTLTLTSDLTAYQPLDTDLTEIAAVANQRGDLLLTDSGPVWRRLAVGAVNTVLFSDGTDAAWGADFAPTWGGVHTFSALDVHTSGINLSTSGLIHADVVNAVGAIGCLIRNSAKLTNARPLIDVQWWNDAAYQSTFSVSGQGSSGLVKQMFLRYDTTNFLTAKVESTGICTLTASGSAPSLVFTSSGTVSFAGLNTGFTSNSGVITLNSTGGSFFFNTPSITLRDGLVFSNVANVTGTTFGASASDIFNVYGFRTKAGASSGFIGRDVAGIKQDTTQTGNTAITETDLFSYSVPAATLNTDGESVEFEYAGTFANSVNTKQIKVKFGATTVFDSGALAITGAGNWVIYGRVIRTGAATQKCYVTMTTTGATLGAYSGYATAAETLSGAVTLKITGTAVGASDIVAEVEAVDWREAA